MYKEKELNLDKKINKDTINIKVTIKNIEDVFKPLAYSAFNEKILSKELEEYIIDAVKDYSLKKDVRLELYISSNNMNKDMYMLKDIIHRHFQNKVKKTEFIMKQKFKQWGKNMITGIVFFIWCIILIEIVSSFSHINIIKVAKESLIVIGWVALWEPLTFILFGWRSIENDKQYYKKLSNVPVIIKNIY